MNPTQFYTRVSDGMVLRSGKMLNCLQSTTFFRETQLFGSMSRIMMRVADECHDANADYDQWSLYFYEYPDEARLIHKYSGGVRLGLQCTCQLVFVNLLHHWRHVINSVGNAEVKEVVVKRLGHLASIIKDGTGWSDLPLCGCADYDRRRREERDLICFRELGPGIWQDCEWVATPSVTPDAFMQLMRERAAAWRHNLQDILDRYDTLLHYFNRIPHQAYQDSYFRLASVLPRECASRVISFL